MLRVGGSNRQNSRRYQKYSIIGIISYCLILFPSMHLKSQRDPMWMHRRPALPRLMMCIQEPIWWCLNDPSGDGSPVGGLPGAGNHISKLQTMWCQTKPLKGYYILHSKFLAHIKNIVWDDCPALAARDTSFRVWVFCNKAYFPWVPVRIAHLKSCIFPAWFSCY